MKQQYAKANCLSCLVNAKHDNEDFPEPFRMQENVVFKVTYSEYLQYILSLQLDADAILMRSVHDLINMAAMKQPILYNVFLQDIAFAILKELCFASYYSKTATTILPASDSGNKISMQRLALAYSSCNAGEFINKLEERGYKLPAQLSGKNAMLYKTAVVLYSIGSNQVAVDEINVVYDLP